MKRAAFASPTKLRFLFFSHFVCSVPPIEVSFLLPFFLRVRVVSGWFFMCVVGFSGGAAVVSVGFTSTCSRARAHPCELELKNGVCVGWEGSDDEEEEEDDGGAPRR